jgi:hypothetical protein
MPRKKTPRAAQFDIERIDDDEELPTGGGIPDDDGMIFLKTPNSKDATRGKKKTAQAVPHNNRSVEQ